jgi:hypothetical protein
MVVNLDESNIFNNFHDDRYSWKPLGVRKRHKWIIFKFLLVLKQRRLKHLLNSVDGEGEMNSDWTELHFTPPWWFIFRNRVKRAASHYSPTSNFQRAKRASFRLVVVGCCSLSVLKDVKTIFIKICIVAVYSRLVKRLMPSYRIYQK